MCRDVRGCGPIEGRMHDCSLTLAGARGRGGGAGGGEGEGGRDRVLGSEESDGLGCCAQPSPWGIPAIGAAQPGRSLTEKKKLFRNMVFSKTTACRYVQPWLVAIGGWRLVEIAGWRLAAVGGSWQLVMGGWWRLAAVDGWRLAVGGGWRLVAVGGWWQLAVSGWWSLGAVLKGGP